MLSVNRKFEQSVTTDERRAKVLGADKEKVHGDRTLGNIGRNNNKDAMFDGMVKFCDRCFRVKTNVIVILI